MEVEKYSRDKLIFELEKIKKECNLLRSEYKKNLETIRVLIAKFSHELKTPLNSIVGFGELIQYRTKDEKLLSYSKNILSSSNHILSLIQDIIDITNSQYKPLELSYSIFKPKNAIEEVLNSFNNSLIRAVLIDINICADYTRFKQLIYNLISNAIKFGEGREINIITYIENNYFCFEIKDNGEGIEKADREKIFELFIQVTKDKRKKRVGAGIGLSLCKTIVNAHNGKLKLISKLGKGSTFIFKIPIEFKRN